MVERRVCAFCGNEIEPGTGRMYVKVDGTTFNFCKNKCLKNMIELRRVPRRTAWTQPYARDKAQRQPAKDAKRAKKKGAGKGKPTKMKAKKPAKKVPKKTERKEAEKKIPPPPKKKAPAPKKEGEKKGTKKSDSD